MDSYPLHVLSADDLSAREDLIRTSILSRFKSVVTVLLGGSGGRGAISFVEQNGRRVILSDFDVVVLCRTSAAAANLSRVHELEAAASEQVGTGVSIAVLPTVILPLAPRTNFYLELRKSRIIYGKDLRNKIGVRNISDVDPLDGISMAFNYLHQLLTLYPHLRASRKQERDQVKVAYKIRRSLLGSLTGLLVRVQAFDDCLAADPDRCVSVSRACLREIPGSEDLLASRWKNVWSLARESVLPGHSGPWLLRQWFDVKKFLESLISGILTVNDVGLLSSQEHSNWVRTKAPKALTQNLQFWFLAVAAGWRPHWTSILQSPSMKSSAQLALWYLSNSLRAKGVNQQSLEDAHFQRTRIPLPTSLHDPPELSFEKVLSDISDTWRFASPALGF